MKKLLSVFALLLALIVPQNVAADLYIYGGLGTGSWDNKTESAGLMTSQGDNVFTWTTSNPVGEVYFRIYDSTTKKDYGWNDGDYWLNVNTESDALAETTSNAVKINGLSTGDNPNGITITFNLDTKKVKFTINAAQGGEEPGEGEGGEGGDVTATAYLYGFGTDWSSPSYTSSTVKDGCIIFEVPAWNADWTFKVVYGGTWYGKSETLGNGTWTSTDAGGVDNNLSVDSSAAGKTVTITFALDNKNICASWSTEQGGGDDPEEPEASYKLYRYQSGDEGMALVGSYDLATEGVFALYDAVFEAGAANAIVLSVTKGEVVKYYGAEDADNLVEGTYVSLKEFDSLEAANMVYFQPGNYTLKFDEEGSMYVEQVAADNFDLYIVGRLGGMEIVPGRLDLEETYTAQFVVENWNSSKSFMFYLHDPTFGESVYGAIVTEGQYLTLENGVEEYVANEEAISGDANLGSFLLPESANGKTVTIVADMGYGTVTATWTEDTPVEEADYELMCSSDWSNPYMSAAVNAETNCVEFVVEYWNSYEFKVRDAKDNSKWYGPKDVSELANGEWESTSTDSGYNNFSLPASANGKTVTITFASDTKDICASWEGSTSGDEYPAVLYLFHNGNSTTSEGWDLTIGDAATGNNGEYVWEYYDFGNANYFFVATQLSDSDSNWGNLGTRYGNNVEDGLVTASDVAFVKNSDKAWKLCETKGEMSGAKKTVTVNLKNNTVSVAIPVGIDGINAEGASFNVYNAAGMVVARDVKSVNGLAKGLYIINGKKVLVK